MKTQKKKFTFNSILKYYTIFYLMYVFILKITIFDLNIVSKIFYILLLIKIVVEITNIVNE